MMDGAVETLEPIKVNRLQLVRKGIGRSVDGRVQSLWLCDCGAEVVASHGRVLSGQTKSCGCYRAERNRDQATRHGGRKTPEYSSWIAMRRRCLSPADKDYPQYGGRGIGVCPEWADFSCFLADLGPRPDGTTLDRIDASRGYEPGNARWASPKVQGMNRRGTFVWNIRGQVFETADDAARAFSVSAHTISRWVNGSFDRRRNQHILPRPDCSVEERYS